MITADRVAGVIREYGMIKEGDRVRAGISGGADSMCLLFLMYELKDKLKFTLEALHFNHCIRGAEADADEAFVKKSCEELKVRFISVKEDVRLYASEHSLSEEEAGRILRYRALKEGNPDRIAVAHHALDSAETVLFNLIRGTGLKGLSGIRPVSGNVIRPLIFFTREETESYCRERGIEYREDSTNRDTAYNRNRIRLNIIPEAEKINPAAVRHILEAAEKIEETRSYIEGEAETLFYKVSDTSGLPGRVAVNIEKLAKAHPCLREAVIKRCIDSLTGSLKDITGAHIREAELIMGAQSGKSICLPYGIRVRRSFGSLEFIREEDTREEHPVLPFPVNEKEETGLTLPDGSLIRGIITGKSAEIPNLRYTKWLDYDKIKGRAVWRTRQEGDRISIRGGSRKLKDLFIDEKIPAADRDSIYFLAEGSRAVWIPGLRIGEDYKVTEETERVLKVSLVKDGAEDGNK